MTEHQSLYRMHRLDRMLGSGTQEEAAVSAPPELFCCCNDLHFLLQCEVYGALLCHEGNEWPLAASSKDDVATVQEIRPPQ